MYEWWIQEPVVLWVLVRTRTGAYDTTNLRICRSYIAFVPQILEQKRDCSQSMQNTAPPANLPYQHVY